MKKMTPLNRSLRWTAVAVLVVLYLGAGYVAGSWADDEKAPKNRFFEMRIYTTAEGKLDALHKRFREHTNRLFKKHGMDLVGYWTPTDEAKSKNTLVYILAYPSLEARDKSWEAFRNDPEWQKAFKESRKDGKIVTKVESQYLLPTDYSPIK